MAAARGRGGLARMEFVIGNGIAPQRSGLFVVAMLIGMALARWLGERRAEATAAA